MFEKIKPKNRDEYCGKMWPIPTSSGGNRGFENLSCFQVKDDGQKKSNQNWRRRRT